MMGDALLVSPIMYESSSHARVYFPAGTWYDFYTGRATNSGNGTWGDVYVSPVLRPFQSKQQLCAAEKFSS